MGDRLLLRVGVAAAATVAGFGLWRLVRFPVTAIVLLSLVLSELVVRDG